MHHEPDFSSLARTQLPSFWSGRNLARLSATALIAGLFTLPLVSDGALSEACKAPSADTDSINAAATYPPHANSPLQSLHDHDVVVFGEVVVPTRPCSLGFCAGIKVLSTIKGMVDRTILVAVTHDKNDRCGPDLFQQKGSTWIVFANTGTSKTGIKYLHASADSPSYAATTPPNFNRLEADYRVLRAQLDGAIDTRLGRRSVAR